jgi:pyruvate dehydrogenase E2 component (dihydrolipoamide acetyltransferase)
MLLYSVAVVSALWAFQVEAFGVSKQSPFAVRTTTPWSSFSALNMVGTQINMPALSSTMKEGRVVSWLKNEGDEVSAGEAIIVVESDKADMDVEAFEDGYLAKIIVGEGEMAPVGQAVALIAESPEAIASVIANYEGSIGGSSVVNGATTAAPGATSSAPAGTTRSFTLQRLTAKSSVYELNKTHLHIVSSLCAYDSGGPFV